MNHQPEITGENVQLGHNVVFGVNVVIHAEVTIGNNCVIGDHCIIGHPTTENSEATEIGANCIIRSHSILYQGVKLGAECITGHHVCIREQSEIGRGCSIGSYSDLQGKIIMGKYCRLHSDVHLCQGSVLEDFVFIYPRVTLTNDPYPPSLNTEAPKIGAFSQICTGSTILPGICIGQHCLIGAGSLVTKNISDHSVALGHPATVTGKTLSLKKDDRPLYPWVYRYDSNMPWEGRGFDDWTKDQE